MRIAQKNFKYNILFYDAIAAFIDSSVSLHTTTSISNSKTLGTIRLQHLQLFFFPRFDAKNNRWRGILKFHWTFKHGGINVVSLRGPISFLGRLDEQNMHRNQPTNYMKLQFPHILEGFLNPFPHKNCMNSPFIYIEILHSSSLRHQPFSIIQSLFRPKVHWVYPSLLRRLSMQQHQWNFLKSYCFARPQIAASKCSMCQRRNFRKLSVIYIWLVIHWLVSCSLVVYYH